MDYKLVELVINKWVTVNKWSPSIADIREQAAELTRGEAKSWGDAWGEVLNAVRWHGIYSEQEALDSLDDLTRKVVKRLGYKNICMSENLANERANFRMIYEQEQQRQRQDAQIPQKIKELINSMPNMMLETGADNEE